MHLLQFSVVLGLLGFQVELHVLKLLKILVLDLLSEGLLFCPDLLCFSAVLFLYGFNHVVEFFKMVMVGLLHLPSLCEEFCFKDTDVSPELFHEPMHAGLLDR